jgi:hypothetical protein
MGEKLMKMFELKLEWNNGVRGGGVGGILTDPGSKRKR